MHVLYICHEYPPTAAGGIGTAVANLARGMAKAGHKVSVMGHYYFLKKQTVENDEGVTVYRFPRSRHNDPVNLSIMRWLLRQHIKALHQRHPIDIIEWPDFEGWYWLPIQGIRDVVKLHGGRISHRVHGLGPKKLYFEFLELRTLRNLRNWIGVSQWFNDEWRSYTGIQPSRETIVYNPVNTKMFCPSPETSKTKVVLYSGGMRQRKGIGALSKAARIFLADNPDATLVMVGFETGDMLKKDVLRAAGPVASQVAFKEFMPQNDLARIMSQAAVYVMPSLYESCGNGWIEAQSCGIAVVGSVFSCGPEIVQDGRTGLLADPTKPEDIASKVTLLLKSSQLAKAMGEAGRKNALERFSVEIGVSRSERFYKECLEG
jgi:glycosyltransferase involved in cell wall biosynthesis